MIHDKTSGPATGSVGINGRGSITLFVHAKHRVRRRYLVSGFASAASGFASETARPTSAFRWRIINSQRVRRQRALPAARPVVVGALLRAARRRLSMQRACFVARSNGERARA